MKDKVDEIKENMKTKKKLDRKSSSHFCEMVLVLNTVTK